MVEPLRPPSAVGFAAARNRAIALVLSLAVILLAAETSPVAAQDTRGQDVIVRLRLDGDADLLPPLRNCLNERLATFPSVKLVTQPAPGIRFVLDIVARKAGENSEAASYVVVETFPMEQFLPRLKQGEDTETLLKTLRYYTLQRLHELLPPAPPNTVCERIATDFGEQVLSKEYVQRDD